VETATAGKKCGQQNNCPFIEWGGIAAAVIGLGVVSVPTFSAAVASVLAVSRRARSCRVRLKTRGTASKAGEKLQRIAENTVCAANFCTLPALFLKIIFNFSLVARKADTRRKFLEI
jgi:hypothetical protein